LGSGVLLAASPAKAISYSFTSTGQFACDSTTTFSGTCSLSFNNFTADWDGTNWTFNQANANNTVTISNSNGTDGFSLNTVIPNTISDNSGNGQQILISDFNGSNEIYLLLGSAPSTTGPFLASISSVQVNSSTDSLDTNGFVGFSPGSAQAYAAPYFASALSILPILTSFKRNKRRVLSV